MSVVGEVYESPQEIKTVGDFIEQKRESLAKNKTDTIAQILKSKNYQEKVIGANGETVIGKVEKKQTAPKPKKKDMKKLEKKNKKATQKINKLLTDHNVPLVYRDRMFEKLMNQGQKYN